MAVNQNAHGFSVGDVVRLSGTTYVLAQADTEANAEVAGIVSAIVDANNFDLTTNGRVTGLAGLSADDVYYLSPTSAGDLTNTEPSTVGQVSKPLLIADSTTSGLFYNMRGFLITTSGGGALVWQDVATGVGFTNGATNFGGGYRDAAYAKDGNFIYFRGAVNPGSSGAIFTLPVGYRPSTNALLPAWQDAGIGPLEIEASGVVNFYSNPTTSASLEGLGGISL